MTIPRLQPGEEPSPAWLNKLADAVNSAQIESADFPLERTTAGTRLSMPRKQEEFYAIITESPERYRVNGGEVVDGEYEWVEVVLGEDGFAEYADSNDGLASFYDIDSRQLYNPAYELNDRRSVEAGTIVRMKPYPPVEDATRGFLRRYIFSVGPESTITRLWVKSQAWWSSQEGTPHDFVMVRQCNIFGTEEWGDHFILWLPDAAGRKPNVIQGEVLAAGLMPDGHYVCVSDYLDEQFGTIVWFNPKSIDLEGAIRSGWKLCDGRFGTPDLQGRFIMGIGDGSEANETDIGDTGGFRDHGGGINTHTDHVDHLLSLDDGCFISTLGGESGGTTGTTCPGAGVPGQTDIADGHQHDLTMTWFYKVGFDWTVHPGLLITLTHSIHSLTDNRPRYYVLAAKMRIDNSGGEPEE